MKFMSAIPVEFLHGLGQSPSDWDAVIANLPEWLDPATTTIPSFSAPAHKPFSLDEAARWVLADVADRSEEPAVLVGLSLGSQVAIRAASLEPGLVAGLILSAPIARPPKAMLKLQRAMMSVLPEKVVAGKPIEEGGSGLTKEDVLAVLDTFTDFDIRPELYQIQCPTLVVVGGNDRMNHKSSGEVVESMQDADLQIIPGAGHEWNRTHPDQFAGVVTNWIRARFGEN
ncbi:alpha/beta hydrolase [Gulosibacter molinativorax]|uniref:Alpha/beta hydrolase n=2 Tax=Gulosibacter molinativorax TaxID=256821 RepID=A0ABT7C8I5_9MICO|nr:alpha/beta hydrolase [Gulosibacter molinativorax]QUY62960.1 Hypotetical protein [Gulosibacter molinativorax]